MKALRLTLWFAVGLLLGAFSVASFAIETVPATVIYGAVAQDYWQGTFSNAACNGTTTVAQQPTPDDTCKQTCWTSGYNLQNVTVDSAQCVSNYTGTPYPVQHIFICASGSTKLLQNGRYICGGSVTCPANSGLVAGTTNCNCAAGYVAVNGKCQLPNKDDCKTTKTTSLQYWQSQSPNDPASGPSNIRCLDGCLATFSSQTPPGKGSSSASGLVLGKRTYYTYGSYTQTGNGPSDKCTGDFAAASGGYVGEGSTPNPEKPADTCGNGSTLVTKSGATVGCFSTSTGAQTDKATVKTVTTTNTVTTNANGSKTLTTVVVNNSTGETTTTNSTYASGVAVPVVPGSVTSEIAGGSGTGTGSGSGSGSGSGDGDGDKDHCEDNPNRVSCLEAGEVTEQSINESSINVSVEPASGFGGGSYACPASGTFFLHATGQNMTGIDWRPVCDLAEGIKPVILAFASLAAALLVIGAGKGN